MTIPILEIRLVNEGPFTEGDSLEVGIISYSEHQGTEIFWELKGDTIQESDFISEPWYDTTLKGSGKIDSNGRVDFTRTFTNDYKNEGNENLIIAIYSDRERTQQIGSKLISVKDSIASFNISHPVEVTEGDDFYIRFSSTNVDTQAGATFYYLLNGNDVTTSDLGGNNLKNSIFFDSSGNYDLYFRAYKDGVEEGDEYCSVFLYSDPNYQNLIATSNSFKIIDIDKSSVTAIWDKPVLSLGDELKAGSYIMTHLKTKDSDGEGNYWTYYFTWQSSSDGVTWETKEKNNITQSYYLQSEDEGKKIRCIVNYTDAKGNLEESITESIDIPISKKTYTISPSSSSIKEGETLTTSISTTNLPTHTTLYYSLSGTGITSNDFSISGDQPGGVLYGSGMLNHPPGDSTKGSFTLWHKINNDNTTEGNETLEIKLFSDSNRTTQVGNTSIITITDTSKATAYQVSPSTLSVKEGETLTTSISTTNVAADATLYWSLSGTGITSADFSSGALTGSGTVDSNGDFAFSHTLANDISTEGNESLKIKLFSDSARSNQVGNTSSITITDTSKTPSYTISPSSTSIKEGQTLTTSISTTNVAADATLYWSLSGTGITSADFSSGALTGSGTVDSNGNFSFSHIIANDLEGNDETLEIKLFSDSARNTQVGGTKSITLTSGGSIYSLNVDSPSVIEADTTGKVLTFTLSLDQAVTENTNINYETLTTGTATSGEDFIKRIGVVSFLKGQKAATLNITVNGDLLLEEDETVKVKFSSTKLKEDVIATGTITNNDKVESTYKASVDSPSITETDLGVKTLAFTVTLDQEVTETTTINYQTLTTGTATTGEDFVTSAGVVTFAKGQKVATLNISVNGDADVESDETIQVKFSGAALKSEVIATGTIKNNDIVGTDSNDTLNGTTNNDNLKGGGGSDVIDGGAGDDTVTYTGKFNDYTITKTTTTIQITDIRVTSPDGIDTVQNIEYVQFTDQLVASDKINVVKTFSGNFRDYKFYNKGDGNYEIKSSTGTTDDITGIPKLTFDDKSAGVSAIADIKGVFDQITGLNTDSGEMFRLYNAAFARFPDSSGLEYWINQYSSGIDDSRAVASSFLVSAEFKERYGENITHETYVQNLYLNVLNRELDQGGYDYWVGNLNNGIEQRHEVLLGFSESAENKLLFTETTGLG